MSFGSKRFYLGNLSALVARSDADMQALIGDDVKNSCPAKRFHVKENIIAPIFTNNKAIAFQTVEPLHPDTFDRPGFSK